ncbi:MAG: hypothetical protein APF76_00745 [Desulfitibacter sp. BRH_c19]|nr:MAG: hypothetical protein APF76_00745 [Desulfitibacter sp. BRH_c19]
MEILSTISQILSIAAFFVSLYLIYISKKVIETIRRKSDTDEYNEKRIAMSNQFEADISLLNSEKLEGRLLSTIQVHILELDNYSLILNEKTKKAIKNARSELSKGENLDKIILSDSLAQLKATCNKKGEFFI